MTARQQAYTGSLLDKAGCIDFIHINEYQGTGSVTHSSNLWIGGCSILDWWVLLFRPNILIWQRKGASGVHLSCYHKIQSAGWLTNCNRIFLSVLEAGSLRCEDQCDLVPVRYLSWLVDCWLLIVSSCGRKKAREISEVPFIRSLISFMRAPHTLELIVSQRPCLLRPSHWGGGGG